MKPVTSETIIITDPLEFNDFLLLSKFQYEKYIVCQEKRILNIFRETCLNICVVKYNIPIQIF